MQVLAALLHLGNIKYKSTSEKNMEASSIPDLTNVERVAAILGLTKNTLLQVMVMVMMSQKTSNGIDFLAGTDDKDNPCPRRICHFKYQHRAGKDFATTKQTKNTEQANKR